MSGGPESSPSAGSAAAEPDDVVLPVFPLGMVLCPGGHAGLRIFEPRYMNMAKACLKDDTGFLICLIQSGREVGVPAVPYRVGCLAHIRDWDMPQLGVLNVTVVGSDRYRVLEYWTEPDGLMRGRARRVDETDTGPVPERYAACRAVLEAVVEQVGEAAVHGPAQLDDAAWVSWRLSELLPVPAEMRQEWLEMPGSSARLAALHRLLREQKLS